MKWLVPASLVFLLGCADATEPTSLPEPAAPEPVVIVIDSVTAPFVTAAGAGEGPECNAALRAYSLAVTAYAIALAAVRAAPTAMNIALASLAAMMVVNETANVRNACSPLRPA